MAAVEATEPAGYGARLWAAGSTSVSHLASVRHTIPMPSGPACRQHQEGHAERTYNGSSTVSFMTIALLTGKQSIWHPACGPPRPQ